MSSISYQLLIIAQEYFSLGRLQANLQEVHHQYTSGLVCIGPQASPSSYVDWLFTASLQAVIKLIAPLVIQDAAFYTVHAWASVVGQADFVLRPIHHQGLADCWV